VDNSDPFFKRRPDDFGILPTAVGGLFNFVASKDLKYPPTSVGGISVAVLRIVGRTGFENIHPLPWLGLASQV
jgi:hypothetical protein